MKQTKTFSILMLPTEKAENCIALHSNGKISWTNQLLTKSYRESAGIKVFQLYIISDDEIKEGDWFIMNGLFIRQCVDNNATHINQGLGTESKELISDGGGKHHPSICKKIIVASDKSLYYQKQLGTNTHKIISPKIFLSQLPESFINVFIKSYNDGKIITEVDLEMDYNLGIPIDEPENRFNFRVKTREDNTVIVHESRKYSRDEVINFLKSFEESINICSMNGNPYLEKFPDLDKWISENLK